MIEFTEEESFIALKYNTYLGEYFGFPTIYAHGVPGKFWVQHGWGEWQNGYVYITSEFRRLMHTDPQGTFQKVLQKLIEYDRTVTDD